jgi:hypothetical protein
MYLVPWREKKYKDGNEEKSICLQCLDQEYFWHRVLHRLIKLGAWLTALADGVKETREIRGLLISCAPGTEFIGLRTGETIRSIELLGRRYEDNSRAWDMTWVVTRRRMGKFRVLDVKPEGKTEMKVHCLWVDGKNVGHRFDLTTEQAFILSKDERVPQYVFGQSALVHLVVLISALWALVEKFEGREKVVQALGSLSDLF